MSGISIVPPAVIKPLKYMAGLWYAPSVPRTNVVVSGTSLGGANHIYATPFFCVDSHIFTAIALFNSGAGDNGKKIRMGIYTDKNGYPDALLVDGGEITLDGTSAQRSAVISQALEGGKWYWLVGTSDTAPAFYRYTLLTDYRNADYILNPAIASTDITVMSTFYASFTVAQAYGALPAAFPAGGAVTNSAVTFGLQG